MRKSFKPQSRFRSPWMLGISTSLILIIQRSVKRIAQLPIVKCPVMLLHHLVPSLKQLDRSPALRTGMVGAHSEGLGAHHQFQICPVRADWRAGGYASPPGPAERRGIARLEHDRDSTRGQ